MVSSRSILIIATCFPPENTAGTHRTLRFARYLPAFGWNVHVLTLDPQCYRSGTPVDYALLSKLPKEIRVHRVSAAYPLESLAKLRGILHFRREAPTGPNRSRNGLAVEPLGDAAKDGQRDSSIDWFKNTITLPLATPDAYVGWLPLAVVRACEVIRQARVDAIYTSAPPWTCHLVGYWLKRLTGTGWIADFRDPWVSADFHPERQNGSWLGRWHQRMERAVIERADRVILNTPRSRDDFQARYGAAIASKFVVIPNGFDSQDFAPLDRADGQKTTAQLVVTHAGRLYGKRNVRGLIEAVAQLCRSGIIPPRGIRVRLVGGFGRSERDHLELIEKLGVGDAFDIVPMVPHHESLALLAASDVLLLVQRGATLCVPGKAYEYIGLGKPILALCHRGATSDLIEQEQLGLCVDPDDVAAIAEALERLYRQHTSDGAIARVSPQVQEQYEGRRLTKELSDVLQALTAS